MGGVSAYLSFNANIHSLFSGASYLGRGPNGRLSYMPASRKPAGEKARE